MEDISDVRAPGDVGLCLKPSTRAPISNFEIGLGGHSLKIPNVYPSLKWNNNDDGGKER